MYGALKAVIFDMDGVLIDSEPLWRRAMVNGFRATGIPFTEEDCRKTTGQRFNDVVSYWLTHHQLGHINPKEVEESITGELVNLIEREGEAMEGVLKILDFCALNDLKTGLATSSSNRLMNLVIQKLNIRTKFQALTSAEHLEHAKPHPEVFLRCASQIGIAPSGCIVIEDSLNGVIAAKAAQMRVIAVPDREHRAMPGFGVADYTCHNMAEALRVISSFT